MQFLVFALDSDRFEPRGFEFYDLRGLSPLDCCGLQISTTPLPSDISGNKQLLWIANSSQCSRLCGKGLKPALWWQWQELVL